MNLLTAIICGVSIATALHLPCLIYILIAR